MDFFHLFPVVVAAVAMIMDIRAAKVDNGWILFSLILGLTGCIWRKGIAGISLFRCGKYNAFVSYRSVHFRNDGCGRH